jgi:uncharacterized protein (DUF927 family)
MTPLERVEAALREHGSKSNGRGMWSCPAHDDPGPSLSVREAENGSVLLHCFAGCKVDAIVAALGVQVADLFPSNSHRSRENAPSSKSKPTRQTDPEWRIIQPVPEDAAKPDFRHSRLGAPNTSVPGNPWRYADTEGRTLGFVVRFHKPDGGKELRPLVYAEDAKGERRAWRWQGFPKPWPLYGLAELAQRADATVLVVEGEKACDAARNLFPEHVCVSLMHGAQSPKSTDLKPLHGRGVVTWPDADKPGRGFSREVSRLVLEAGAASAAIVPVPDELPEGWDLADELPEGWDENRLCKLLAMAEPFAASTAAPADDAVRFPFRLTANGVEYAEDHDGEREWVRACSRLEVVALTRSDAGEDWGALLRWQDADGRTHEWAMPWELLARADGSDWLAALLSGGLIVAPGRKARQRLHEYLTTTRPPARVRCVSRVGWHGHVFVLPDVALGASAESVRLQTAAPLNHAFRSSGTLEEWQHEVAAPCVGNSRLVLAVSAAFAAPLLALIDAESGGFHFRGPSSIGKTTALRVAGSVWGGGGLRGYIGTWRATANGLEAVAAAHCDALLCLDELSEVEAREAGAVAYMLANGTGKARARRDGGARSPAEWRALFLSSGEIGLADKVREDGKRKATAGQAVRVVDVPADAGAGLGLLEELHGSPDAAAFVQQLGASVATFYGTAGRAFVAALAEKPDDAADLVRDLCRRFLDAHVPTKSDGQVRRVAERFALAAAAGELAIALGIVPWPERAAVAASEACLRAWLSDRGGIGPAELADALERVRGFFLEHGSSRFDPVRDEQSVYSVRDRAGWWREDEEGRREWLLLPKVFKDELAAGFDSRALAKECIARGWLRPDATGRSCRSERVSNLGKVRVYVFTDAVVGDGDDD